MEETKLIKVFLEREKETLRTVRYQEVPRNGQPTRVGTQYLSKVTVADLGDPERLRVTIENDDLPVSTERLVREETLDALLELRRVLSDRADRLDGDVMAAWDRATVAVADDPNLP